jgi:hypothetical protein
VWIILGLLLLSGAAYLALSRLSPGTLIPLSAVIVAPPIGDLPVMAEKPQPSAVGFNGCPPEGRGGDPQLNVLKNRVDKGDYVPVSFATLIALTWPKSVESLPMGEWSSTARAFISQYMGIPVVVAGYIVNLREGGGDPASCGQSNEGNPYWRIYLAANPRDSRAQSVVAYSTPQTRIGHTWSTDMIRSFIMAGRWKVRLSGWLYFDPQHPQDVGRTRATLWEISPVMQIEVFEDGRWNPLDRYAK